MLTEEEWSEYGLVCCHLSYTLTVGLPRCMRSRQTWGGKTKYGFGEIHRS